MKKTSLLIAAVMAGNVVFAEPIDDLLKAAQLKQRYKYAAAAELYGKVIKTTKDAGQLETAQLYYAICLGQSRKKAEALKAAEALKNVQLREYAEMSIIAAAGNSAELIARFGNTDLSTWSDKYEHYGWYMRGRAFANRRQYERGLKELEKAVELAGSDTETKLLAWMDGASAAHTAKMDDVALKFTGKALKYPEYVTSYMFLRPMCIQAEIQISRKQLDDAAKTLALAPKKLGTKQGAWDCRFQQLKGDLALAKGDKEGAKKCYEQAKICAGKNKYLLKGCDSKLKTLL